MDAFIYSRKSQEDEGRQVQSIEDQQRENHNLAAGCGLHIVDDLTESFSAKRPGRPVFNAMLDRIERGEAQCIVAWHPDRLSRNAIDAGRIIDLLDRGKLLDLKFDSYKFENTPEGKWMLSIVLGQAKYENDKKSVDVTRGIRSKVQKGIPPRRAIAGYINDKVEHTYEADPERFDSVQRAIRLILSRTHNPCQALRMLNHQWGFRTLRSGKVGGKPLSSTSWYDLLTNPVIAGHFRHNGELHSGKQPAMISMREFDTLQKILGKVDTRPQKYNFDFTGLIRCGQCGCLVVAERKVKHYKSTGHRREYLYYHCSGRRGCSRQSVSHEYIEDAVVQLLQRVTIHPKFAERCLSPARRFHEQESGFRQGVYEALMKKLANAQRKKSNLLDLRLSEPDAVSVQDFKAENVRLQQEINEVQQEIRTTEEKFRQLEETVLNVFHFAVNAELAFREGDIDTRRSICQMLGIKHVLTLGKLEIEPHPLLVPIITFEPPESSSQSHDSGDSDHQFSEWLGIPDKVRTLAIDLNLMFPKIECSVENAAGLTAAQAVSP